MKKYLLLLLLFSIKLFSQNYNSLKESDTIYIELKGKKIIKKKLYQPAYNYNDIYFTYTGLRKSITFYHFKNKVDNEISIIEILNKKEFLKKHKHEKITSSFLKNNDLCDVERDILHQLKIIYLIDFTEKLKDKIILYRVVTSHICPKKE